MSAKKVPFQRTFHLRTIDFHGTFVRFRGINTKDCYVCFVLIYPMDPSVPLKKIHFLPPENVHSRPLSLDPWIHRVGLHLPLISYTPIIYPGHQGTGEMFQVTNSNPSQNPRAITMVGFLGSRNKVGPRDATL